MSLHETNVESTGKAVKSCGGRLELYDEPVNASKSSATVMIESTQAVEVQRRSHRKNSRITFLHTAVWSTAMSRNRCEISPALHT